MSWLAFEDLQASIIVNKAQNWSWLVWWTYQRTSDRKENRFLENTRLCIQKPSKIVLGSKWTPRAQDDGGSGKKNKIRYQISRRFIACRGYDQGPVTLNRHASNSDLEVGNVEYEYEALLSSPKRRQLDKAVCQRNGASVLWSTLQVCFDCMSLVENGLDYI